MLDALKKYLIKNSVTVFRVVENNIFARKVKRLFFKIFIYPRSKYSPGEIHNLTKEIPWPIFMLSTFELHKSNAWYGHAASLKKYAGYDNNHSIKAVIEHGSSLNNYISEQDLLCPFPSVITFSKSRANYLEKVIGKKTYAVGPYIYYAPYLSNKVKRDRQKERLGKNLLAVAAHSSEGIESKYNIDYFCKKIKKYESSFDKIRVLLYWKDIRSGVDKVYEKYGFECITAGHVFDPLFLPRLKEILGSSTAIVSNFLSTHVAYCMILNRPLLYINQDLQFSGKKERIKDIRNSMNLDDVRTAKEVFGKFRSNITSEQKRLSDTFWGTDQIKTKKELRRILKECEDLYSNKLSS